MNGLGFLMEFLKAPRVVGALWPSSRALSRSMVALAEVRNAGAVVELGPGTGVFSREILAALPPSGRFLGIERNPRFAALLASSLRRMDGVVASRARIVEGCATRLGEHLTAGGFPKPGAVLSGLPWASFDAALQEAILDEIRQALAPGGRFVTFAYFGPHLLGAGQRFRKRLETTFGHVERSPLIAANLPPAFIYRATEPRR